MDQIFLGIDYGAKRVGVAISDSLGMMAHPLETIPVNGPKFDAVCQRLAEIVTEKHCSTVVVGLPRNMDGSYGPSAEKARQFAAQLQSALPAEITVVTWDERLTTVQAQRALHDSGRNTRQSRPVIDQVAAQMILQNYMDAQALQNGLEPLNPDEPFDTH